MNLRKLREMKKISQTDLAKKLNIPLISYTRYENEVSVPNLAVCIKLADYYSVSIDYLVGRDTSNNVGYLNEQETELINTFRNLNQTNKGKGLGYIKALDDLN